MIRSPLTAHPLTFNLSPFTFNPSPLTFTPLTFQNKEKPHLYPANTPKYLPLPSQ